MTGWLVAFGVIAVAGIWLVVSAWRPPRPSVDDAMRHLRRRPRQPDDRGGVIVSVGDAVAQRWAVPVRWHGPLRLIGRSPEVHLGAVTLAGVVGALAPVVIIGALQWLGVVSVGVWIPAGVAVATGVAAGALVHADAMARAEQIQIDLRHQLGAYLDMVTMLLAGNSGYEGALEQAARAGDGRLFTALSRRMREAGATGESAVVALERVADDYGLVELEQVAATTTLSAAEGAPVARSLAAKCSTLRSTLAAEQETAVRIRTDKVTPPLVGMALLFMALIIYPALNLT